MTDMGDITRNSDLEKFIKETYTLKALQRYNNKFRIISESVAEHSFFVALIVVKLHEYYEFDLGHALKLAVLHDVPEAFISDVTWDVKARHPNLSKILYEVEQIEVESRMGTMYLEALREYEEITSVEAMICKMADAISVKQYTSNEIMLGNEGYMREIYVTVTDLITKQVLQLKNYEKEK